ncbi:hypothetical protein ABGB17_30710 [Sphaerisporangium sp. B11E5]
MTWATPAHRRMAAVGLHFWSGATLTYHVTRPGSSVTGTPS